MPPQRSRAIKSVPKGPAVGAKAATRARAPQVKTVAAVERALDLLDAFRTGDGPLTLAAIAQRAGLYKSTVLRLAHTLETRGYLIRLPDGTYQVGFKPFSLGAMYQATIQPETVIVPALEWLVAETRESASFSIRQGDARVRVYRVQSPQLIRDQIHPGDVGPLARGAAGHILLAFADPPNPRFREVRETLIARSFGEVENQMTGLGAPVFDGKGGVSGALVLSGPSFRFTDAVLPRFEELVLQAACRVTEQLGGDVSPFASRAPAPVRRARRRA